MKQALPQAITLSSALPTATLPHLSKLTDSLNELLAQHGVNQRFTPSELNHILRADFRMIVSQDGMVMRVGHGDRSAELKIKLELSDLVEILDPDVKASEIMLGTMPQGGRTGRGTHAGSIGFNGSHKPATLFAPEGLGTALLEGVGSQWAPAWHSFLTAADVEFAASMGRGWSRDGSAAEFALGGAVEDNRGESMLFDAAATWKVRIRTARTDGWQDGVTISSGNPEDAASQRIWVAHSYADQPSKVTETLDPSKRSGKAMPEGVVSTMTGLHDLADRAMARLGESRTELGTVARDQLRTMITEEMPSRLNEEITRVITDETGRPVATVTARSRIKVTSAVMIGGRSADHWMERLRIAFSAAAGGGGFNGSLGGSISASLAALLGFGLKLKGGRGVSRSASGFVNDQAIHPSVHRVTDPTQGYQVEVETEISIQPVGDKQPRRAVKGKHEALIRLPEQDAFDIGLPVAREALVTDKDGNLVLDAEGVPLFKVDSLTDPPAGRKAELPVWVGDMDWQMKGAGACPGATHQGHGRRRAAGGGQARCARRGPHVLPGRPAVLEQRAGAGHPGVEPAPGARATHTRAFGGRLRPGGAGRHPDRPGPLQGQWEARALHGADQGQAGLRGQEVPSAQTRTGRGQPRHRLRHRGARRQPDMERQR
ncbi:hypothetical protein GCM10020219_085570 [Nonomuraea dietziae]